MPMTKKALKEAITPAIKAIHRAVNDSCVGLPFVRQPGHFESHNRDNPVELEWEGFAIEVTCCRRPRVVCNVPTPYSLYTFNYCLKKDGKPLAYGTTIPEFVSRAFIGLRRNGIIT
jgi:hypothetical protein